MIVTDHQFMFTINVTQIASGWDVVSRGNAIIIHADDTRSDPIIRGISSVSFNKNCTLLEANDFV